jgi:hypothetical protein
MLQVAAGRSGLGIRFNAWRLLDLAPILAASGPRVEVDRRKIASIASS